MIHVIFLLVQVTKIPNQLEIVHIADWSNIIDIILCEPYEVDMCQEYYQSHHFTTFRQLLRYSRVTLYDKEDTEIQPSSGCGLITVLCCIALSAGKALIEYSHIWSPTVFAELKQKVGMQIVFYVQKAPSRQSLCSFSPVSMCMSEPSGTRCGKPCSGWGEVFLR